MANTNRSSTSSGAALADASAGKSSGGSFGDLRNRASSALDQFGEDATSQIGTAPLIAVAGGLAIGALIAAVLPQTERETRLLEPVGTKVTTAGRDAVDKVREAGKAKVDELAGDKVREFFGMGGSSNGGSTSA